VPIAVIFDRTDYRTDDRGAFFLAAYEEEAGDLGEVGDPERSAWETRHDGAEGAMRAAEERWGEVLYCRVTPEEFHGRALVWAPVGR
jgi:hypothetical protein